MFAAIDPWLVLNWTLLGSLCAALLALLPWASLRSPLVVALALVPIFAAIYATVMLDNADNLDWTLHPRHVRLYALMGFPVWTAAMMAQFAIVRELIDFRNKRLAAAN